MQHSFWQSLVVPALVSATTATMIFGAGVWMLREHPTFYGTHIMSDRESAIRRSASGDQEPSDSSIVSTIAKVNPAVVAITISKNVPVYERRYRNMQSPFDDFFGGNFFNFSVPEIRQNGTEKREVGGGSGFIVSSDGYIITNRHVVDDADAEYTVVMNDDSKHEATVIARDTYLDLAVLKIEGSDLPYLVFGNSEEIKVGQGVIAIGNTLAEFRNTVSVGIVSGLSRSITASNMFGQTEHLDKLIQTDAAINQGNSGGPLLNTKGEVIGVNVAVAQGAENVGFAISGNSVKNVFESVLKNGTILRPYLGVRYIPITPELQKMNNLPYDYGVLVQRGKGAGELAVIPGSPSDKAGIAENDIILTVDGIELTSESDLSSVVRAKNVGDIVELLVSTEGKKRIIRVTLEAIK
jgi:serine protease Do